MIYLASDHRGFELKTRLFKRLIDEGYEATDLGNDHFDSQDDYPDFAKKVAVAVENNENSRGILLCGSGVGVDITANKIDGVRSVLAANLAEIKQAREDDDVNVISLPADNLDENVAWEMIKTFLETPFSKEKRHQRRLQKLQELEENN